jgi:hypothetical protein
MPSSLPHCYPQFLPWCQTVLSFLPPSPLCRDLLALLSHPSPGSTSEYTAHRITAWEAVHATRTPPLSARSLYAVAAGLEACALYYNGSAYEGLRLLNVAKLVCSPDDTSDRTPFGSLRSELLDYCMLHMPLKSPPPHLPTLETIAQQVSEALARYQPSSPTPVAVLASPTLRQFKDTAFTPQLPLKMLRSIAHWPALSRWANLEYLWNAAGLSTVPVETTQGAGAAVGGYLSPTFNVSCVQLRDYIEDVGAGRVDCGYLAQFALFGEDALPGLRGDFTVPDLIAATGTGTEEGGMDPLIQAWLGPSGTYTPLHHDATHNLLAQVVGCKRVRLLPPHSPALEGHTAPPPLGNTSTLTREALTGLAAGDGGCAPSSVLECILEPGDVLFIPVGWFHEVESLTISVSVSFWW